MLALLSPAKTMNFEAVPEKNTSMPVFPGESAQLAELLKKATPNRLKKLMSISDKLAELNYERWQDFNPEANGEGKQAILTFTGDVYIGLDAPTLSSKDLGWAQDHIRILSGLYGILKPLDLIQPYRLEMGTRLRVKKGKDLYGFWGDKITQAINEELREHKTKAVINLASNEYFQAVRKDKLEGDLYEIKFLEERDGKYRFIQFTGKKARGWMSRFIIDERIDDPEGLKGFSTEHFFFNEELSGDREFVFTREGGIG